MAIPKLTSYSLPAAAELPANKVKWTLEPQRAALLIHDMQAYFLNFWGENGNVEVGDVSELHQRGVAVFQSAAL